MISSRHFLLGALACTSVWSVNAAAVSTAINCDTPQARAQVLRALAKKENVPKASNGSIIGGDFSLLNDNPANVLQVGHAGVSLKLKNLDRSAALVSIPVNVGGSVEATLEVPEKTKGAFGVSLCTYARSSKIASWADVTDKTLINVTQVYGTRKDGKPDYHDRFLQNGNTPIANPTATDRKMRGHIFRVQVNDADGPDQSPERVVMVFIQPITAATFAAKGYVIPPGQEGFVTDPKNNYLPLKITLAPVGMYLPDTNLSQASPVAGVAPETPSVELPPPSSSNCLDDLRKRSVAFDEVKTKVKGVIQPVTLKGPINGVEYEGKTNLSCEFVRDAMWELATIAKKYGYTKIGNIPTYCYRCMNNGKSPSSYLSCPIKSEPPYPCTLSNHSFGRALDIMSLYKGTEKSVLKTDFQRYGWDDTKIKASAKAEVDAKIKAGDFDGALKANGGVNAFVPVAINSSNFIGNAGGTCHPWVKPQLAGKSVGLYGVYCDIAKSKFFKTYLSPNTNKEHAYTTETHFHFDAGAGDAADGLVK